MNHINGKNTDAENVNKQFLKEYLKEVIENVQKSIKVH